MQSFTKIMSEAMNVIVRMSIYHANYTLFITYADLNPEALRVAKCSWYIVPKLI